MTAYTVAAEEEINKGERMIVEVEGNKIAIFNVNDEYYAYQNQCLHQYGPVCEGNTTDKWCDNFDKENFTLESKWVREEGILNCPWHEWEFDLITGECLSLPSASLPSYPVTVKDGEIILHV